MKGLLYLVPLALSCAALNASEAGDPSNITVTKAKAIRGIIEESFRDSANDLNKNNILIVIYQTAGEFAYDWVIWAKQAGNGDHWNCGGYHWDKDRWFGYTDEDAAQKEKLMQFVKEIRELAAKDRPVNVPAEDFSASSSRIEVTVAKGNDSKAFGITEVKGGQPNPEFKDVGAKVDIFLKDYLK